MRLFSHLKKIDSAALVWLLLTLPGAIAWVECDWSIISYHCSQSSLMIKWDRNEYNQRALTIIKGHYPRASLGSKSGSKINSKFKCNQGHIKRQWVEQCPLEEIHCELFVLCSCWILTVLIETGLQAQESIWKCQAISFIAHSWKRILKSTNEACTAIYIGFFCIPLTKTMYLPVLNVFYLN